MVSILMVVVLPAPFGPRKAKITLQGYVEGDIADGGSKSQRLNWRYLNHASLIHNDTERYRFVSQEGMSALRALPLCPKVKLLVPPLRSSGAQRSCPSNLTAP